MPSIRFYLKDYTLFMTATVASALPSAVLRRSSCLNRVLHFIFSVTSEVNDKVIQTNNYIVFFSANNTWAKTNSCGTPPAPTRITRRSISVLCRWFIWRNIHKNSLRQLILHFRHRIYYIIRMWAYDFSSWRITVPGDFVTQLPGDRSLRNVNKLECFT